MKVTEYDRCLKKARGYNGWNFVSVTSKVNMLVWIESLLFFSFCFMILFALSFFLPSFSLIACFLSFFLSLLSFLFFLFILHEIFSFHFSFFLIIITSTITFINQLFYQLDQLTLNITNWIGFFFLHFVPWFYSWFATTFSSVFSLFLSANKNRDFIKVDSMNAYT